jgi:hypothetical protein
MIDKFEWVTALPKILECKTKTGTIFAHGFEDSILRSVARTKTTFLTVDMIEDAKKITPGNPFCDYIPVWYKSIDFQRRKEIVRIVPQKHGSAKQESAKRPFLFRETGAKTSNKKMLKRLGRFMDRESKKQQTMLEQKLHSNR